MEFGTSPKRTSMVKAASMLTLAALAGFTQPGLHSQVVRIPAIEVSASSGPYSAGTDAFNEPGFKQARGQITKRLILQRQKQINEDGAKLLKLATDLKAQVDTGGKETSPDSAIRKADEIARLARNVREEMKQTFTN
jgi:hypothetical protein